MKVVFLVFSYLLGAFPTGYVFFCILEQKDIRNFGSGSIGVTNFYRLKGAKWSIPVALIDVFKGALPVYLGLRLFPDSLLPLVAGFLAVAGHCFPLYLKFRGGKGVATTFGVCAVLAFKPFLIMLATFVVVIALTRFVSLGSLVSVFLFPFYALLFGGEKNIVILGLSLFVLIVLRHLGNIHRLVKGRERKLGEKV
ncbi:MAG: glycerol-3-phosphate 1-O-acyltransferase PlsY [Candidatus Aminicenantales bacterium]